MTNDEIINGYLEHLMHPREADSSSSGSFRAWEAVTDLIDSDPERAWVILMESFERCPSGYEVMISAGPLEELIMKHSLRFVERLAERLLESARFRSAFESVYFSTENVSQADAERFNAVLREKGVDAKLIPDWRVTEPEGAV